MDGLGSLTLIVKAPNQRIEDQRVACDATWTVRQLKEHLSTVHPEKPHKDKQKLVYFGKLLKDEACLQEVLTQESYEDAHTVHLVCPSSTHTDVPKPYIPRYTPAHPSQVTELRQRFPTQATEQTLDNQQTFPPQPTHQWTSWSQSQMQQTSWTPQQMMWWRLYEQQCAAYNALLQQQMNNQQSTTAEAASAPQQREEQRGGGPAAPAEPAPPAQNEAVRMNAQGGVEPEGAQNDWLDNLYAIVRFSMLLSLLYFYTTLNRFAIVLLVGAFFYFAQGNRFRLQRRRPAAQPAPQQPLQNEQNQAENQNNENSERVVNQSGAGGQETNNNDPVVEEQNTTWTDGLKVVCTFFVTFFSSLIPQNPAPIRN